MMDKKQVSILIRKIADEISKSNPRVNFHVEFLYDDQFIVNCKRGKGYNAEDEAFRLSQIVEAVLNEEFPPVEFGWYWHASMEPCYWRTDPVTEESDEVEDFNDLQYGDVIQFSVYKNEKDA